MSQQDKSNLRRAKRVWQSRQNSTGVATRFLLFVTCCAVIGFICAPGPRAEALMVGFIVLLFLSCSGLICSAAKVVEVRRTLQACPTQDAANKDDASLAAAGQRAATTVRGWNGHN